MTKLVLRITLIISAALAVPGGVALSAEGATQEMIVYGTALDPAWQNWSWAKTELSVELNGSARRPIKVEAGPYQALYLHHDAFSTAGFKQLSMLIQGSAPGGVVHVFALIDGKPAGDGHLVALGNAGWTQVVLPLAVLAADDKLIDGIWVQNATGSDMPRFYVTEIKLN